MRARIYTLHDSTPCRARYFHVYLPNRPQRLPIPPPHLFYWLGQQDSNLRSRVNLLSESKSDALPAWRYPNMEIPIGFEPMILGLQPRALPLGYGIIS